jgi:dienelactone hydrolase
LSCATIGKSKRRSATSDYFHYKRTDALNEKGWVVLMPGASGLKIFKDTAHYFQFAEKLNREGYSVILVDHKKAYKASGRKVKESVADMLLFVLDEALNWGKDMNYINTSENGHIIAWSLSGTAMIQLAKDEDKLNANNIKSVTMFYPAIHLRMRSDSAIPILILTGGSDIITPHKETERYFKEDPKVRIRVFENAHHGFDVESLKDAKIGKIPPVIGKKYIFKYNENAAKQAVSITLSFLDSIR